MSTLMFFLLFMLVASGLYAVLAAELIQGAIGLAACSLILSIIMYELNSPLGAVFELSVCAGLITVVFLSTISLTKRLTIPESIARITDRRNRFAALPAIMGIVGFLYYFLIPPPAIPTIPFAEPQTFNDVRTMIWETRRVELIGQMLVILAGVFGIVILFKGWETNENREAHK